MKQRDHYRQILLLVSRIGRLTNPQHLPLLKDQRISLSQFLVLGSLDGVAPPMRMTDLAEAAGLTASELTRVVAELETKGWVARRADPEDSRAKLVAATAAGARLSRRASEQATTQLRGLWSDFTHDEWHRFIDYLERFERGLKRTRTATVAASRRRGSRG